MREGLVKSRRGLWALFQGAEFCGPKCFLKQSLFYLYGTVCCTCEQEKYAFSRIIFLKVVSKGRNELPKADERLKGSSTRLNRKVYRNEGMNALTPLAPYFSP